MTIDQGNTVPQKRILDALGGLPLFGGTFLYMQAMNIDVVDQYLEQLESDLLREYSETETTPMASTMFVSALSQLWVFGLYELIRTWKQWVVELIEYDEELKALGRGAEGPERRNSRIKEQRAKLMRASDLGIIGDPFYNGSFEEIEKDSSFVDQLRKAKASVLPLFRKVEALRVTLAKHEVPKTDGIRAQASGYARIDMITGALLWLIDYKDSSSEIISRRDIAEGCRDLR